MPVLRPILRCPELLRRVARGAAALVVGVLLAGAAQAASYNADTSNAAASANPWIDISSTGTPLSLADDAVSSSLNLGFTFYFGATAYSSVRVASNGMLMFAGTSTAYTNAPLPLNGANSAPNIDGVMLPLWDDLNPSTGGQIRYLASGTAPNRVFTVSWLAVRYYNSNATATLQVQVHESGKFVYRYGAVDGNGGAHSGNGWSNPAGATIGFEVGDTDYVQFSRNSASISNGSAIVWTAPGTLLAEYRFEELAWNGTSGEVTDSSGNGRNGTRVNSTTPTANGYLCRGLDVPADTSILSAAVDTGVAVDTAIGNSGSISFWYRYNNAWGSGNDGQLFDATTFLGRSFHLVRRSNGSMRFAVSDSAGTTMTASSANLSYGASTWVYITATWRLASGSNNSSLNLLVNGSSVATATGTTTGSLDSSLGTLYLGDSRANITSNNATINSANGQFDELKLYSGVIGVPTMAMDMGASHTCPVYGPDHYQLEHDGAGLTCTPETVTVKACANSSCSSLYSSGALSGNVAWSGAASGTAAFSIGSGSSSTTVSVPVTTVGSVTLATASLSPTVSNPTTCLNTATGAASCALSFADSGLLFDVPNHVADSTQTVSISAVRKSDNSTLCTPAFASTSKSVTFACSYTNPATGTLPVRVAGAALNGSNNSAAACDAGGRAVSLAFNASGVASMAVQYADVGRLSVTATYTGSGSDAGLVMSGSDTFIAAPASFTISGVTAAPIKAGSAFAATVTAKNSNAATTPNFGRETSAEGVTLSFTKRQPIGSGAVAGSFSGSTGAFTSGAATATNLVWTEVGNGDLSATLASASYLGSGFTASGSTGTGGAVGRFIPHHFDVAATAACGSFTYAGQPYAVTLTARNAANATTLNYDGSANTTPNFAKAVTLAEPTPLAVGTLAGTSVAAAAFSAGIATATPSYAYTTKQTGPKSLVLRATDTDAVSSSGYAEPAMALRSGRLRLVNGVGAETQVLKLAVIADYWSGNAWILNSADSCTTLAAGSVAKSNQRDRNGNPTSAWSTSASAIALAAGQGQLSLSAPGSGNTGTLDLALNLGATSADQSCLASHPASSAGGLAWLRSLQGSCAATWDRDPAARASFGVFSAESKKTVHVRELF